MLAIAALLFFALSACGRAPEGEPSPAVPPNILVVMVDTLRFDHLGFHGYPRPTSPEIERWITGPGVVMESAYAAAPWTLPSVASLFTGAPPAAMLDELGRPWGIPEEATTLAEHLRQAGYATAAFVANPTVHVGNGFGQGFDTFYSPPYEIESLRLHGDDLNAHALPWIRSLPSRPFFLYLHYIDPHDPYDTPEIVDGRSPFYPDYPGHLRGHHAHGLYLESVGLSRFPERDLRQMAALYDSEIRYVDRRIGEIFAALPADVLANTLVVFTSDHGEELGDHGGWKHGETLYEEMIHVPLALRWDGHLPAGQRLGGNVRLLDLLPTLLAAAGVEAEETGGVDLLPFLAGRQPPPDLPAFAQHLSAGPLRASVVRGGRKLILFDREAPFTPQDEREAGLWRRDVERMERIELYDLENDPRERHNLASPEGGEGEKELGIEAEIAYLERELDRREEGLRLRVSGLEEGARLRLELRLATPPDRVAPAVTPWFLRAEDQLEVADGQVTLLLMGEDPVPRGISIHGSLDGIESLRVDSIKGSFPRILRGSTEGVERGPIELRSLLVAETPPLGEGPWVRLWIRHPDPSLGEGSRDQETELRLRALGYTN